MQLLDVGDTIHAVPDDSLGFLCLLITIVDILGYIMLALVGSKEAIKKKAREKE